MSIQTEINRISNNISSALSAIADKGVAVPSGSKSGALAGLIAKINGIPAAISKFAYGTYTPTSNITDVTITHDLGVEPDFFILTSENGKLTVGNGESVRPILMDFMYSNHLYYGDYKYALAGGTYSMSNVFDNDIPPITTSTVRIYVYLPVPTSSATQAACLKGGEEYRWMAGVWA